MSKRPQQDSNLRSRLRRPLLGIANSARCLLGLITHPPDGQVHSAHIPVVGYLRRDRPPTVQGMARVRSGQAPAWPLFSDRSVRRGSGVKRDFACTFTRHFSPVLVVLRSQSRLRLEGRARTLSGPSPDLRLARTPALSACTPTGLFPACTISLGIGPTHTAEATDQPSRCAWSDRDGLLISLVSCPAIFRMFVAIVNRTEALGVETMPRPSASGSARDG